MSANERERLPNTAGPALAAQPCRPARSVRSCLFDAIGRGQADADGQHGLCPLFEDTPALPLQGSRRLSMF
jgi:hypothetical protein